MVSFDVKNLFINIPNSFTLNLILDSFYVENSTKLNDLNKSILLKLFSWTTKNTTFWFNNKLCKQLNGVVMSYSTGFLMADLLIF